MTRAHTMLSLADDYLDERRALGFDLRIAGNQIKAFARFVDDAGDVAQAYGVWGEKMRHGRKYFGIQRSTLL